MTVEPLFSPNQAILAQLRLARQASDTPAERLISQLRGLEETLLSDHRRYARLLRSAAKLGLESPAAMPAQIVARAEAAVMAEPPGSR
jgi:hypothetical protein